MDYLKENLIGKEFRSIKYENGSIMIVLERGSIAVNTKISCSILAYTQSINIIDTDSGWVSIIFSGGSEIRISRVIEHGISPESFVYNGDDNVIIVDNSIEEGGWFVNQ
ncbi:MAG: hypothetical protein E5W81_04745 [Mesorhizobium sp.]|nr:MAG: hypothetical protein E5V36_02050 [Mesorhizobium sp.]TKB95874.1 MAG: hypothetical protein E5W81_04745 [Mesorhizobium sp.]